jgi:hypothetical protein
MRRRAVPGRRAPKPRNRRVYVCSGLSPDPPKPRPRLAAPPRRRQPSVPGVTQVRIPGSANRQSDSPAAARSPAPPPPPPPAGNSRMFQAPRPRPQQFAAAPRLGLQTAPPPAPPAAPGHASEFTRMFPTHRPLRRGSPPPPPSVSKPSAPPPPPPPSPASFADVGLNGLAHTQHFPPRLRLPLKPAPPPARGPPSRGVYHVPGPAPHATQPAAPPANPHRPASPRPGEFTRLFNSPHTGQWPPRAWPAPARPEPGEFTRLFQAPAPSRPPPASGGEDRSSISLKPEAVRPTGPFALAVRAIPTPPRPRLPPNPVASTPRMFGPGAFSNTPPPHPPPRAPASYGSQRRHTGLRSTPRPAAATHGGRYTMMINRGSAPRLRRPPGARGPGDPRWRIPQG